MVIWLVGLSGAGKSTVGHLLYEHLKVRHPNLVFLDGDVLRNVWGDQLGHTIEARRVNAHRISHLCGMLDKQNIHVVAAVLSIFPEWQSWNRENFSSYYEIFLDVPMDTLRQRDVKGLYARAARGETKNVVGVDLPFPRPANADMVIGDEAALMSPEKIVEKILGSLALPVDSR